MLKLTKNDFEKATAIALIAVNAINSAVEIEMRKHVKVEKLLNKSYAYKLQSAVYDSVCEIIANR
jgi:GTP cyclohydrolase II